MIPEKKFLKKYNISEEKFEETDLKWSKLKKIYFDYESKRHNFETTAKDIAERLLSVEQVHSVRYRVKDSEHLIEKIIRNYADYGDISVKNYLDIIDDIIGVRALHLFKNEWEQIDEFISSTWDFKETPKANIRKGDPEELINKCTEKSYEINQHKYGYRSLHYIIFSSPTKEKFKAELQVRTIFEEGWSEIDHTLRYPYDMENPILLPYLKIFNRLAGSADEMGTYIKFLQTELEKKEMAHTKMIQERDEQIKELREKINKLKIDEETKTQIDSDLNELAKPNWISMAQNINNIVTKITTPPVVPDFNYLNDAVSIGSNISNAIKNINYPIIGTNTIKTCPNCNKNFHSNYVGIGVEDEVCNNCSNTN